MVVKDKDFKLIADSVRLLSMDAIQKANSGHPGLPLGCADLVAVLWGKFLQYNPDDPAWLNRDRFILSAGHGSMLLYAILHLSGYKISLNDLKNFRQLGSLTPGHPENQETPGVETTTGPLGQGFANGVGMALAHKMLAEKFKTAGRKLFSHYTYALVSDGDIMEGISEEAASLAGHLGLGKMIYLYDSNNISIEGSTDLTFSEKVDQRFKSYGWQVQKIDGHNYEAISKAIKAAQQETQKPSLIIAKTKIAKGSPTKEGTADSHGAPLGSEEIKVAKKRLGYPENKDFYVPKEVFSFFKKRKKENIKKYDLWHQEFKKQIKGSLKKEWDYFWQKPNINSLRKKMPVYDKKASIATRSASGQVLEVLFKELPNFLGGSADLGPSNKSFVKGYSETGYKKLGRNIHFGIREHAMGAIQNGIAYYGGFTSFSATFFVFMDYMRPAIRIAALSGLPTIYSLTHDSFFVGEDGPTHQPVEHLAAARAIPNLNVIRPADAEETNEAWLAALKRLTGPTLILGSRQNLPVIERKSQISSKLLHKGAYILKDFTTKPDLVILASGSEVSLALQVGEKLLEKKISVRVVSFPCWELFDQQGDKYKKDVLLATKPKVVIEAGLKMGWAKYAGPEALYITIENFGSSGPAKDLARKFGFTVDKIVPKIEKHVSQQK